ncbi:histone acetyltransferase 1 [Gaertneriomyces semiglobifer]|nr:histone acetyltransferase 1 [Gaertneriomyces semiglobifer]
MTMAEDGERSTKRRRIDPEEDGDEAPQRPLGPWEVSANESLKLALVNSVDFIGTDVDPNVIFSPEFTYPVFGEEEVIFGYKDLEVNLYYAAGSLDTYMDIQYREKCDAVSSTNTTRPPDDVEAIMTKLLPQGFTTDLKEFKSAVHQSQSSFKPMGEKISDYQIEESDSVFELYKCDFTTPGFKEYHRRLQLFLLWMIEGASFIEEDDDRWHALLVFERTGENDNYLYLIVGYMTYYEFFFYPNKKRMRISQFLVLPPYQGQGHGSALYRSAYSMFLDDTEIAEVTVEDPNETFCDLRDRCDLQYLLQNGVFEGLKAPVTPAKLKEIASKFKLAQRQADRCVEMGLLRSLNTKNRRAYKAYRLQVKRRIYLRNREALLLLDAQTRLQKLEETYADLEEDYRRIYEPLSS